jgi:pyruvate kinase
VHYINGRQIGTRVMRSGKVYSYAPWKIPTTSLAQEAVSEQGEQAVAIGAQAGVDFVAVSGVTSGAQVQQWRKRLSHFTSLHRETPGVIAKIDKNEALLKLESIAAAADAVWIAGEELGLPGPQSAEGSVLRDLVRQSAQWGTPVAISGDSDFLIVEGVPGDPDAVLLPGAASVSLHDAFSRERSAGAWEAHLNGGRADHMVRTAVDLARHIDAQVFIVPTRSGYSARMLAGLRPGLPMVAATVQEPVAKRLTLSWGVTPLVMPGNFNTDELIHETAAVLRSQRRKNTRAVVVGGLNPDNKTGGTIQVVDL